MSIRRPEPPPHLLLPNYRKKKSVGKKEKKTKFIPRAPQALFSRQHAAFHAKKVSEARSSQLVPKTDTGTTRAKRRPNRREIARKDFIEWDNKRLKKSVDSIKSKAVG